VIVITGHGNVPLAVEAMMRQISSKGRSTSNWNKDADREVDAPAAHIGPRASRR
jgi:hypothetical protein